MIAIQSIRKLQFPPASVGYVRMEIDLIQNKPNEEIYNLRIVDTCFDLIMEKRLKSDYVPIDGIDPIETDYEEIEVEKVFGANTRYKNYSYDELRQLAEMLNGDGADNEIDQINDLFKQGLLITTQGECMQGLSGEGLGMYFSKVDDWVIC